MQDAGVCRLRLTRMFQSKAKSGLSFKRVLCSRRSGRSPMHLNRSGISPSGCNAVTPAETSVQTAFFLPVAQYSVLLESQSRSSQKKSASKS